MGIFNLKNQFSHFSYFFKFFEPNKRTLKMLSIHFISKFNNFCSGSHFDYFHLGSITLDKSLSTTLELQGDSKRWTQLNSKRRLNTRQTVGCGIPSSLLALRVDLRGLRSKLTSIHLTFSSDTRDRPELLPLHRQTICSNW